MRGVCCLAGLVIAMTLCSTPHAQAASVTVNDVGTFVSDQAHVLTASDKEFLENTLKQLEQQTTAQVKVITVPSLGDEDVFDFTQRHFRLWKLGQKAKNNGALIVLSVGDRKVRIHSGYGLEGLLPDSWCGTTSRAIAAQYFKSGQYSEGLKQLTLQVANRIADDAGVKLNGTEQIQPLAGENQGLSGTAILIIIIVILIVFVVIPAISNRNGRRGRRTWSSGPIWTSSDWGGSSGGWSGGSSFGGGSFGGGGDSGGGGGGASW